MTETRAKTMLIIFGNLLILAIGGGIFGLFLLTNRASLLLPSGLILGIIHIAFSMKSLRQFKNKCSMTAGRYVAYSAMPAFGMSALMFIAGIVIVEVYMPVIGDISAVPLFISLFPAFYSLFYLIGFSMVISLKSLD